MSLEKRFGQSAVFVASTLMENGGVPQSATPETLLKEAIHVISCGYEDKSEWGQEVCNRMALIHLLSMHSYVSFSVTVISFSAYYQHICPVGDHKSNKFYLNLK
jgi:hypothetical protein